MRRRRLKSLPRRCVEAALGLLLGGRRIGGIFMAVDGFLFPHEAVYLRRLARDTRAQGRFVEIGSMQGLSTLCIAHGLSERVPHERMAAIDPHLYGSEAQLRRHLQQFSKTEFVDVIVDRSASVAIDWDEPVRCVFIDGAHDLASVTQDFESWLPHVVPGGYVLVHDSTDLSAFPGPQRLAEEHLVVGDLFEEVGRIGSISWGRRRGGAAESIEVRSSQRLDRILLLLKSIGGRLKAGA